MPLAIYKVPNGKLLKIFLETENDKIADLKITGDFFLYPEEKITLLEDALKNEPLDAETLKLKLENLIQHENLELFGLDAESIVTTILMAAEKPADQPTNQSTNQSTDQPADNPTSQ